MKTKMQQTSLNAYKEIIASGITGDRQREVYNTLRTKHLSNLEISHNLSLPINCITGRVNELVEMGLVEKKANNRQRSHSMGVNMNG